MDWYCRGMVSWDEMERVKQQAPGSASYGVYRSVVFSLILSLAVFVIISKKHLMGNLWVDVAAFAVPLLIALYFKSRIVLFGAFVYVGALILALSAAVLFGI